jgi:hypothetical protein
MLARRTRPRQLPMEPPRSGISYDARSWKDQSMSVFVATGPPAPFRGTQSWKDQSLSVFAATSTLIS